MSSESFFIFHCVLNRPASYVCVGLFPGMCVCVYVRDFMHQPGNCRCWFVCIQGSACSRTQESLLKAISSSKVSPLKFLKFARNKKNKTKNIYFISMKIFSKRNMSLCTFHFLCCSNFVFPKCLFTHRSSFCCSLLLPLTVGLVLSVPAAGGRYTPATGCGVRGETHTTWHVLPATRARGSSPRGRSLVWWRRRSCVESTTTPWWRTSNEQPRVVSA